MAADGTDAGDRTVGIDNNPSAELLSRIEKVFGFHPPHHHGRAVVDTIQAIIDGQSNVFIGLGGDANEKCKASNQPN